MLRFGKLLIRKVPQERGVLTRDSLYRMCRYTECIKRRAAATKLSKETDSNPIIHQSISRVFGFVRNSRTASNPCHEESVVTAPLEAKFI